MPIYEMERKGKAFFMKAQFLCEHESGIIIVRLMDMLATIDLMSSS